MSEFVVYILYSPSADRIYIGFTSDLINRIASHNIFSKSGHTVRYRPWIVAHVEFLETKKDAMNREKSLKGGQGRKWIYEEILPEIMDL
ncbi:MAG: GIY-YIG nuclease family protein [Bacteroidota bacterium]